MSRARRRRAARGREPAPPAGARPPIAGSPARGSRLEALLAPVAFLVTLAVFLPALRNGFVSWDDPRAIYANPDLRGLDLGTLRWAFSTFHMGPYQPLAWLSLAIDRELWALDPIGFHLTAVLLHSINAALVFRVAQIVFGLSLPAADRALRATAALVASLLWALHPLRVESVAWATERRDVLSALFFLLAVLAYLRSATAPRGERSRRLRSLVATGIFALLAVLSKPIGPMLVGTLVLLDFYPLRRLGAPASWRRDPEARRALLEKIPFLLLGAASALVALHGQEAAGALWETGSQAPIHRWILVVRSLAFYPFRTLLPTGLAPLYEVPFGGLRADAAFAGSLLFVLGATAAALLGTRRRPAFSAAWALFLIHALPVSGLFQAGPQYAADRYSYLSCLGFSVLVGGLLARRLSGTGDPLRFRSGVAAATAALLILLATLTVRQISIWSDSLTLWNATLERVPTASIGYSNRGAEWVLREDWGRAKADLERSLELFPTYADAWSNLAYVRSRLGDWRGSAEAAHRALEIRPGDLISLRHLGAAEMRLGRIESAVEAYERAVNREPADGESQLRLASLYQMAGRLDEALAASRVAVDLAPSNPTSRLLLAALLELVGRPQEALEEAEIVLELDPGSDSALALVERLRAAPAEL